MQLQPGEEVVFDGHPSWRSVPELIGGGLVATVIAAVAGYLISGPPLAVALALVVIVLVGIGGVLKRIATHYMITNERIHIRQGILSKSTQETRIQRVQNVNTAQSVGERILGIGTVDFDTAGNDAPEFRFIGVANPAEVVRAVDRAQRAATSASAGDPAPTAPSEAV